MPRVRLSIGFGLCLITLIAAAPGADAKKHSSGPLPDLVTGKISNPPASLAVGAKLTVLVKVRNKGPAKAGKSKVGLYLAKGKKHVKADLRLRRGKVKGLPPGKTAKAKLKVVLSAGKGAKPILAGSYRLIACADDTEKVREAKEGDNCHASRALALTTPTTASTAAAPAFTTTDGLDWGFAEGADGEEPAPGDPITATMTAANGIAGQSGYTRSSVAPEGLVSGASTSFVYSTPSVKDDGADQATLPFGFPFGGIDESSISVSTNGWVSFGQPALDYWGDEQATDYRGVQSVVGDFERGIMPYWGDLDVGDRGAGAGTVTEVIPPGGGSVAFQWDIGQHSFLGVPRRTFQLVLFPDGRFRFDYPGTNPGGGGEAFVGYSLGTGPAGIEPSGINVTSVPTSSVLFTPNPVAAGTALPDGRATLTLPAGSSFLSGDPGCAVLQAPGPFTQGLASCPMTALASGQQVTRQINFATPPNAPGQTSPANFDYLATYTSGGSTLTDGEEADLLDSNLASSTFTLTPKYSSPPTPKAEVPAIFKIGLASNGAGFARPVATFTLPANSTLDSVKSGPDLLDCDAPTGGQVVCRLPSGFATANVEVTVTPSAAAVGSPMTLGVSAQALNAPPATGSALSPSVTP